LTAFTQKWSRGQIETRLANLPPCLMGMVACVGAHHLSRKLTSLGHNARLMPAKYVRPYSRGQKNDFRDARAAAMIAMKKNWPRQSVKMTVSKVTLLFVAALLIAVSMPNAGGSI
jgi:transposase